MNRPRPEPGSIRNGERNFSLLRIPNWLFESRGQFLGEDDPVLVRLVRFRAVSGFLLITGFAALYGGHGYFLSDPAPATSESDFLNDLGTSILWTFLLATGLGLVTALVLLFVWTDASARGATARRMATPLYTMLAFGVFAVASELVFTRVFPRIEGRFVHSGFGVELLFSVIVIPIYLTLAYLCVKAVFFVVTDLFRADDGHPFIAPVVLPLASLGLLLWGLTHSAATAVPSGVAELELVGAFASNLVVSVCAILRMKKKYQEFPFRNGPVG